MMGEALGSVWSWIKKRIFNPIVRFVTVHIPQGFRNARDRVSGAFSSMKDRLASVGIWIRKNVFGKIVQALRTMRNGFRSAKNGIAKIWSGLKSAASRPIRFLINTVWNKGLRKMINAIPGVRDIEPTTIKFARGGPVRGGIAGKDSVRALLMPNEHVWTAREVQAAGGHRQMLRMRKAVLEGNLNGDPKFANGGSLSADDISRAQKFAQSQRGKPYGWGAVGPRSYDCSGFMSAITNVLRGKYPHNRVGATAGFPWNGFKRGPGQFTIGSTRNYGGSGIGHMSGTLGGLKVESRGGRGVLVGSAAMGAYARGFNQVYHLGASGKAAMNDSSGGWLDTISKVVKKIKDLPGQIAEMASKGGWMVGILKQLAAHLWSKIATYINNKIPNWGPIPDNPIPKKFARGGMVMPRTGGTHIIAGEAGYREAIVPLDGPNATRLGGGGGGPIYLTVEIGGKRLGELVIDPIRREVKNKGGGDVQAYLGGKKR
jgi:hypothetical protein